MVRDDDDPPIQTTSAVRQTETKEKLQKGQEKKEIDDTLVFVDTVVNVDAAKNVKIREKLINDTMVASDKIVI
ncbi:hypothetical protein PPTG_24471 [Phytophthora nicotianae INRA-310]|uniref:Uncharacterized protein n=1 Tax=Phytophthora nicotianae (strain INRA-310) TaxID=761204 RepID=W2PGI9_PHYN3|nr:hypothetical protein PPTG_24471 [Phytophthora nicotianae INRA-310]ETM99124.1 hypothetical protein PPTG_24471 [Phytophthora nicotianae INRA-310]